MSAGPERLAAALADRYRIERELGQGGMATVYLAQDLRHGRRVAIKVLRPELAAVIGAERFLTEIRTTANLQHPHILPLFDSGNADSLLFYAMPFVEGISLRDRMAREKQLPIAEAVRIASEVASALDYAHRHGVIHRDIKPENILLHDGSALVADFGIALAASKAGTRMTETGMSLGTPQYMSPEQAMGERELDARSDVYALGCVTYEMLTGEPPFTGPTAQAIVAKVMTSEPADIRALRRMIPPHVADAVHVALQKLPADRFATAQGFADALADPARGLPARSAALRSGAAARRIAIRPALAALIGVAGLVAGAIGMSVVRREQVPSGETVRVRLQFGAGQEALIGRFPGITAAPDGSRLVYHGPGGATRTQLWIRRWDRLQAQPLAQSVDESCCAAFSPSGDTIAYLSAPRQLNLLPLTGGLPASFPDIGLLSQSDFGGGLDWGSDGWIYASGAEGLLRIDPRAGTSEVIAPLDSVRGDMAFLWPQLLPGGQGAVVTIALRAGRSDPERALIGVSDFRTGRVESVMQGVRAIYAPTGHLIVARPNGVLLAVPFDAGTRRTTGVARELADTVALRFGSAAPGGSDLTLDARGTLTYVAGGGESFQTVWVERSGTSRPFSEDPEYTATGTLDLSPDGRRLALAIGGNSRTAQLWVQPVDGGPRVRLSFDGDINMRPRWRPGTGNITYLSNRETPGATGMRLYEREGGGQGPIRRVVTGDPRAVGGHAWSPDGRWLLIRTDDQEPGAGDIIGIRPGVDPVARPLVATEAEELAPAVSPDGRWLAYTSNESGRREVYVRPFPETAEGRYQVSTAGGITPVWSRDGRELFYIDGARRMVAVPIVSGSSFQFGQPAVLFSTADYATTPFNPAYGVSLDGRRFVMSRRRPDTTPGIVVVFNFLAELERLMRSDADEANR
ncbi:MAG TPA: protein kinase [Gemmatimonadales bacterium]|nr:protein kinase [Gemmatimonadales bacterium]